MSIQIHRNYQMSPRIYREWLYMFIICIDTCNSRSNSKERFTFILKIQFPVFPVIHRKDIISGSAFFRIYPYRDRERIAEQWCFTEIVNFKTCSIIKTQSFSLNPVNKWRNLSIRSENLTRSGFHLSNPCLHTGRNKACTFSLIKAPFC